ncbi:MAG: hypothetical protein WBE18_01690 [Gammaproteobacteria bacterium]
MAIHKHNKRKPASKTHDAMVAEWMTDSAFKTEYDALEKKYQLLHNAAASKKTRLIQIFINK